LIIFFISFQYFTAQSSKLSNYTPNDKNTSKFRQLFLRQNMMKSFAHGIYIFTKKIHHINQSMQVTTPINYGETQTMFSKFSKKVAT
jgi:hypothetical protein